MFLPEASFQVLYTTDIEKTFTFYKLLGFEVKKHETDKVVIGIDSLDFHFILNTTEPFDAYKYIANNNNYGQGVIFYIGTSDIKEAYKKVGAAKGTIKTEIFQNHWNAKEFLFEDPNGYKFAMYQEI